MAASAGSDRRTRSGLIEMSSSLSMLRFGFAIGFLKLQFFFTP